MRRPDLVASTPSASWLPDGSTARVWAGADLAVPHPCIIIRLLLTRRVAEDGEFFCVPTSRGLDLPTLPLAMDGKADSVAEGLARLAQQVLGQAAAVLECVGYVRNVVPRPDADYPYPTPWAHVPVFTPSDEHDPIVEGSWLAIDSARQDLSVRHWWPIVEHHLGSPTVL